MIYSLCFLKTTKEPGSDQKSVNYQYMLLFSKAMCREKEVRLHLSTPSVDKCCLLKGLELLARMWTKIVNLFLFCTDFIYTWVTGVCCSQFRLSRGKRQGTPLKGRQPITGLTHRQTTFTLTPTVNSDWSIRLTSMSLDCGRKLECPWKTYLCIERKAGWDFESRTISLWGANHCCSK